jgi:hypothetical protein
MLYTILEASKLTGISKVTAYKKISAVNDLKNHITIKNNTQYIDTEGLEKLKMLISKPINSKPQTENQSCIQQNPVNDEVVNAYKALQEDYILLLKSQIEEKDRQLSEKDRIITDHAELLKNSQVLLQQSQQKILCLESSNEKPPWWKRIFS